MNESVLSALARLALSLGIGLSVVGAYVGNLGRSYQKPAKNWIDRFFGSPPVEYHSPKGPFYITLGRWLRVVGFVLIVVWIFFLSRYDHSL
jgi:hypothetical protein